jgi:hypothetical protein
MISRDQKMIFYYLEHEQLLMVEYCTYRLYGRLETWKETNERTIERAPHQMPLATPASSSTCIVYLYALCRGPKTLAGAACGRMNLNL